MYLNQRSPLPIDVLGCEPPEPTDSLTTRLNTLLNSSGPGYTLSLCPGKRYNITAPLLFAAPSQEISTAGYPTGSDRATLVVSGSVANGTGHTTAIDGKCANCDGVKLRNVNGSRLGGDEITGGANIEMGGPNANQIIEYVHSFDPRSWSCLHVDEGGHSNCTSVTVQNNYLGPAGSNLYQQWADGISFACRNGLVRNNLINNPTDGGIVLYGSPGTRVENNTIWVETHTLLGGINLVDHVTFKGNYTGVVVANNTIVGAFASEPAQGSATKGINSDDVVIKVGIAIGPHVWSGDRYGNNISTGAIVQDNKFTGAFSYGIAISSAANFTVENNVLFGNTSFIGTPGPNCSTNLPIPSPVAFLINVNNTKNTTTQCDFESVTHADHLICVDPPDGGKYWPFKRGLHSTHPPDIRLDATRTILTNSSIRPSGGITTEMVISDVLFVAVLIYFLWIWALKRLQASK